MAPLENTNKIVNQRIAEFSWKQFKETGVLDRTHWDVASLAATLWSGLIKSPCRNKWYLSDTTNFIRVQESYIVVLVSKTLLDLIMKFWREGSFSKKSERKLSRLYFDVKNAEFMKNVMYFLAGMV